MHVRFGVVRTSLFVTLEHFYFRVSCAENCGQKYQLPSFSVRGQSSQGNAEFRDFLQERKVFASFVSLIYRLCNEIASTIVYSSFTFTSLSNVFMSRMKDTKLRNIANGNKLLLLLKIHTPGYSRV